MVLAIFAFGGALFLGAGDAWLFAIVCVASGAAMGADLTLLPALFATRMAQISPSAAEGFGLWSFVSKFTLALSAAILLPVLEGAGYASGSPDAAPEDAIDLLRFMYAVLKLAAIFLLWRTKLDRSAT